jgi:hypothetical protein
MAQQSPRVGPLQLAIILLALATASIHIYLALFVIKPSPDVIFLLNGLGYLGLTAALYLPLGFLARWRSLIRWVLIGYTALTVLLWVFMALLPGTTTPIGWIAKAIEVTLIVLLFLDGQREGAVAPGATRPER